ncbi:MAG TPA: 1-acyl-sn-glycerol-3-phosphate acyltransferase [Acidimicrobiales bacterium]|nr:1-acyl-sn-glycerol-3-phosphate acyltransferase [Acidimicrobiales bacterium]
MIRRLFDAILHGIARLAVRLSVRSVEVQHRERFPTGVPVLVVSNHFNGFVDPVLLTTVLPRTPRFLAKSTLWKVWPARPLLAFAGAIPVYRPRDGGTPEQNRTMFRDAEAVLRADGVVAIFPEGTTHDAPQLADLRTGAARIALSAHAGGAQRLAIAPVSLLFESKLALRSRALVRFGRAIDMDTAAPSLPQDEREAVRRLTDVIDERLTEVVPPFADVWEEAELEEAAAISLRSGEQREVPLGRQQELAEQIVHSDHAADVRGALQRYVARLHILDAADEEIAPRWLLGTLVRRLVVLGLVVALAVVVLAPALAFNLIPAALVAVAGMQPREPVTKGTVRLLTGLVVFPVTWITVAVLVHDRWYMRLGWIVYQIAACVVAIPLLEAIVEWFRGARSWWHLRDRRGLVPDLLTARADVVDAGRRATGAGAPSGNRVPSTAESAASSARTPTR